ARPRPFDAAAQLLAPDPRHAAARLRHEDVAGADIPIVKRIVGVEVEILVAAGDAGELDAGRVRLDDAGRMKGLRSTRLVRIARPALHERRLAQLRAVTDTACHRCGPSVAAPAAGAAPGIGKPSVGRLEHDAGADRAVLHETDHHWEFPVLRREAPRRVNGTHDPHPRTAATP